MTNNACSEIINSYFIKMENLVGRYVKYLKKVTCWTGEIPELNSYHMIRSNFGRVGDGWYLGNAAILQSDFTNGNFELMPKGFFPPSKTQKEVEMFPVY